MVSNGCIVRGLVVKQRAEPGVYVSPWRRSAGQRGHERHVDQAGRARLDKVVVDKKVVVGAGAVVGTGNQEVVNEQMPTAFLPASLSSANMPHIPDGAQIGRNVPLISSAAKPIFRRQSRSRQQDCRWQHNAGDDPATVAQPTSPSPLASTQMTRILWPVPS